jgi:ubiquinone/menaquinone biosynthesis C-methylase UbiE
MEGPIASWYAKSTRGRMPMFRRTADAVAATIPSDSDVLEIAPGPGYLSIEIAKLGRYRVTGLDISRSFVRIASDNAAAARVAVDFRHGDVAQMPFADESFDFAICQAAFKNFPDPVAALNEIHRVLRPGGSASIQDLRKDASAAEIDAEVRGMGLGAVNTALTKLIFRFALLRAAYTTDAVRSLVSQSRFGSGELFTDGVGFDLRLTKR